MSLFDAFRPTRRSAALVEHEHRTQLADAFRQACIGAGVSLAVDGVIAGTGVRTPEVTRIDLGPPIRLTVRMLPGQVPADLARHGRRIAPHLGGLALRVLDRGHGWALVTILTVDPLAEPVPLLLPRMTSQVLLGRDETGAALEVDYWTLPHIVVQGQTRSGKSTWLYGLLAQLSALPLVDVAGVDPSGLTLRPFAGTRHGGRTVLGLADLDVVERVLSGLVADMDARLAAMPHDVDVLPITRAHPLVVVVLEEYPGTLRALDATDVKQGKRVRALVARLLAESHKVGFRVVLAAQRAEASIVGGAERGQCGGRLSFRVDGLDSVKLLHPGAEHLAEDHANAPAGVALVSWPGRPVTRLRAPFLGGYPAYARAVAAAAPAVLGGAAA